VTKVVEYLSSKLISSLLTSELWMRIEAEILKEEDLGSAFAK